MAWFRLISRVLGRREPTRKESNVPSQDWRTLAGELSSTLGTDVPPIAITFTDTVPQDIPAFDDPMPAPNAADGRTGRVSAGCVFWMKSTNRTFSTVAEDH